MDSPDLNGDGGDADIAAVARLFGDETRAAFCIALLDGRFWTAGELARSAGVAASTASEHLAQLVAAGVLEVVSQGRHRYFRLAGPEMATALEALAVVSPAARVRSLRQDVASRALRDGRTCYDHLAGRLGVGVTQALISRGIITADFGPGDLAPLAPLGIKLPPTGGLSGALPADRRSGARSAGRLSAGSGRSMVRPCVDWTERQYHAAGLLPSALLRRLIDLRWLEQLPQRRAVRLTDAGRDGLADLLPIPAPADRQPF